MIPTGVPEALALQEQNKYKQLLDLQKKYRAGIVKDEDLTLEQKILLSRLCDIQTQRLENENEKNLDKIIKYKKKINI